MGLPDALPTLSGGPITLRGFVPADASLISEASSDPLIPLITTVPRTADPAEALAFIDRQHARLRNGEGYSLAITVTATGAAIGQIGLWLRDLAFGRASVGYWIAPSARRQGYAAAAIDVLSSWGLALPGVHRLELYVEPWNEGSWRAAERAGYRREGLLRSWQAVGDERRDMYMYARLPGGGGSEGAGSE